VLAVASSSASVNYTLLKQPPNASSGGFLHLETFKDAMRLRLLLRRLTVSASRMAVRSALPWPFLWAVLAIVAGFYAAIGLHAFKF
jgi:hypothetical protein